MVDRGVDFFYIFNDYLYSCSVNCWERLLKSLSLITDLSIFGFSSTSFCSTYFQALLFGTYTFKVVASSWNAFLGLWWFSLLCDVAYLLLI